MGSLARCSDYWPGLRLIVNSALVAGALTLAGCSPPHKFYIGTRGHDVASGTLTLYDVSTPMTVVEGKLIGERANRADGSGWMMVVFADGSRTRCPIGYVTNGEGEPHRYVIRDGRCFSQ